MPWNLERFQEQRCNHFITFSCYKRQQRLGTAAKRDVFAKELERVRRWYGVSVYGYVVMPEHVHLLLSEPERKTLAVAIQMLKQIVARRLRLPGEPQFWQARYYSFPVWTEKKRIEKLRYMHRNPVERGLAERPENWRWSSFHHYATGEEGVVEIESPWTARKREKMGIVPQLKVAHPVAPRTGATRVGQPKLGD